MSNATATAAPARASAGGPLDAPRAFAGSQELAWAQMLAAPVRWPRPSRLGDPLEPSSAKMADGLAALGLDTSGDLLEHLPRDHREARSVAQLRAGEQATVAVQVRSIAGRPVRRRGMRGLVEAGVFDETGSMRATFFNQPWLVKQYPPGTRLVLHGKADGSGRFRVSHHAIGADIGSNQTQSVAHYPAAEGVSSTQILALVNERRHELAEVPESLAAGIRVAERLCERRTALAAMHFGGADHVRQEGLQRLAFEELLLTQLVFLMRRGRRAEQARAPALADPPTLSARWLEQCLPFELTGDQRKAIATIAGDLAQARPMQRLLMGEVGSGKTVVALHAMLRAVEHGAQAALMAPTETLAEQHFATVQRLLGPEPVAVALLTGSTPAARRADTLGKLSNGELSLVVGTHALIEPDVRFRELAVAVVDEQHRFGVRQRAALGDQDPARAPHTLHMTATPIPRTLALARHGDLDRSLLRELPRGRQAIDTRIVVADGGRADAYRLLLEQLELGRQGYVVCPLVDEDQDASEAQTQGAGDSGGAGQARAAISEFERLGRGELAGRRLALLHGQMRPREKQQAMVAFASGQADVLVATTVIEVGVDVPNATVMLVENAERFGISQLHQLRGRVGRGEHRSTCLLLTSHPSPPGSARLQALVEHSDGFELAEIDLRLRKQGELVGTRQSGLGQFKFASLPEDTELLERARARAKTILTEEPALSGPLHGPLGEALERAFGVEALQPIPA
ncbi:MAG TPA: ATP-dependent DNA helicase RecG [Solirubrobacteraceae bacterium]|jgi:ATP-dependent DNA helicase RecG|nr:ATP-dependent DNA helicase RecG [Solirubrobacteraceae bacterium]